MPLYYKYIAYIRLFLSPLYLKTLALGSKVTFPYILEIIIKKQKQHKNTEADQSTQVANNNKHKSLINQVSS